MTTATDQGLSLTVAEAYSRVTQGEGPSTGRLCAFIRLGGCNLTCGWRRGPGGLTRVDGAWACDEAFTWHPGHGMHDRLARRPVTSLLDAVDGMPLVVITGGEPLLHQDQPGWRVLLDGLLDAGCDVEVETNGTLTPVTIHKRVSYNVSPKLASSGVPENDRVVMPALRWHALYPRSVFKFVAAAPADVDEAAALCDLIPVAPRRVWIMPEGISPDGHLATARAVAPAAAARGFNLTLRQHVLLYGEAGEPRDG